MFAHLSLSPIRLTAVVLFLLTNVACMNVVDSRPSQIQYDIQLMYQANEDASPAYHKGLRNVVLAITLEEGSIPIDEDESDYNGHAFLIVPHDYWNRSAKLIIQPNANFPTSSQEMIEIDMILGDGSREFDVLVYESGDVRVTDRSMIASNISTPTNVATATPAFIRDLASLTYSDVVVGATGGGREEVRPAPIWQVICEENFDPPQYQWQTGNNQHNNGDMILTTGGGNLRQIANFTGEASRLKVKTPCVPTNINIRLEADITFADQVQSDQIMTTLMVHHTRVEGTGDESYYAVGLTNRGEYWVGKKSNGLYSEMISITPHPSIYEGHELANRIAVEFLHDTLHVQVNGTHLVSLPDPTPLTTAGSIWLGIEGTAGSVGVIDIDNIRVSQLQN